jgi:ABC-type phosphate transport system substrate-binding protein
MKNDKSGVSPVIATLMLILVAVGSAVALYAWQSGWQKSVTGQIGSPSARESLTIGGSTTLYDFNNAVASMYEARGNAQIAVSQGGSGLGLVGAAKGSLDIGSMSETMGEKDADYATKYPDLNNDGVKDVGVDMVQTKVAYDAVVPIIAKTNVHKFGSATISMLSFIYKLNGGVTSAPTTPTCVTDFGYASGKVQWDEIPTTATSYSGALTIAAGVATITYTGDLTASITAGTTKIRATDSAAVTTTQTIATATYAAPSTTIKFPSGDLTAGTAFFQINCAGAKDIKIYGRADNSGTEGTWSKKIVGLSTDLMEDSGLKTNVDVPSNNEMAQKVGADNDALGFLASGVVNNPGTTVIEVPFLSLKDFNGDSFIDGADLVSISSTKWTSAVQNLRFETAKPLYWITAGAPKGATKALFNFVLIPENNVLICKAAGTVSVY